MSQDNSFATRISVGEDVGRPVNLVVPARLEGGAALGAEDVAGANLGAADGASVVVGDAGG
jgi:hypothetical protein